MTQSRSGSAAAVGAAYDALGDAKRLLRTIRSGALATFAASGHPFATLVNVATDADGSPILLISSLSVHARNLAVDSRCSILLAQSGKGDPLAHPRLTVIGAARETKEPRIRARFLRRHPKANLYADFGDFAFRRLEVSATHLNGGFARAADFPATAVLTEVAGAEDLIASEEAALADLNQHHAEALRLYATRLAGKANGRWRATGVDPDGLDLLRGDLAARVPFPARATTGSALRAALKRLTEAAERAPAVAAHAAARRSRGR